VRARTLGRVLINQEARRGAFDVRLSPNSGAKADIAGGPRRAQFQTHAAQQVGDERPVKQPVPARY
jgi:hypothetical protein